MEPDAGLRARVGDRGHGSTEAVDVVPTVATTAHAPSRSSASGAQAELRRRPAPCAAPARASARPSRRTSARARSRRRRGRPVACRAAASAASVEVDAVSSMWPCQPVGQAEQLRRPSRGRLSSSVERRRRSPEDRVLVERRGQQLREDRGLGARDREVREEARATASASSPGAASRRGRAARRRTARPRSGGDGGSRARTSPGLDLREHRELADPLEVARRPLERRLAVLAEVLIASASSRSAARARVQDLLLRQPCAACLADAELDVARARATGARRSSPRSARRPRPRAARRSPACRAGRAAS